MFKKLIMACLALTMAHTQASAQRATDALDRGLVAVQTSGGVYCSWRILGEEYYDVTYNLYRDGVKVNSEPLSVSNYTDAAGTAGSQYSVRAVVRGQEQAASHAVTPWAQDYLEITLTHEGLSSSFEPNDVCAADLDGDGELELLLKCANVSDANKGFLPGGNNGEYDVIEALKLDGTRLWWIDAGPNMTDFQHNELNIVAYDWDGDGRAECVMRAADGTVFHMADGTTQTIGDPTKNYRNPSGSSGQWFIFQGDEYLVYLDGLTGKPYQVMEYPLRRLEPGETDLNAAWGDGYGHRSSKHFFGAPYLDGRKPSIFLARGIYTRHKMVAYDVDPATHELTERWRWNCNSPGSPWYGQGYHNYQVADVDWDGRDEIVFGSMVIDDCGRGLSTTGLGHGDAQHCSDFNPYVHGQEMFACNEDLPANNYRDATTSKIYYRLAGGGDDGRSMAGNFSNDYPGAMASSGHDTPISCVTADHIQGVNGGFDLNFRIYWDGDLLEETVNGVDSRNSAARIFKFGKGVLKTMHGTQTNNDTKATPCYQGDLLGDWREELVLRTTGGNIRIYTTTDPTPWRNYTLWHDTQYRQAMVWQMCGYNQPPHTSYFLGELEGITMAPPPLTNTGREEIAGGGSIGSSQNDKHVLLAETGDMTVSVADGASPYILTVNAPSWVQGHDNNDNITTETFTHTLTGGAFTGTMRLVKQGDGVLVLPNVTETYSGNTDIWAGTVRFDGTLQNSHVWMNRFGQLESDGGRFLQGIEMQYGSVLRPGGADKAGTLTVSDLQLGFGARVAIDMMPDGQADHLAVTGKLSIEKKDWQYGPEYDAPVIQVITHFADSETRLEGGRYTLGTVGQIEGNIDDIKIEGLSGQKTALAYEDGTLYLDITAMREATDVVWSGSEDGNWDFANTANFLIGGEKDVFVSGDNVVFNDEAANPNVVITTPVSPSSVTFDNSVLTYTLSGDSIVGPCNIEKKGTAETIINNVNRFKGTTTLTDGILTVSSLGNATGAEFGALGGVANAIRMNGGTLRVNGSFTGSHPIQLDTKGGSIEVPANTTFTADGTLSSLNGKNRLAKKGNGTLKTGKVTGVAAITVSEGTLQAGEVNSVQQYPDTVVLMGGIMRDVDDIYSYSSNPVNVKVPADESGTWYLDQRCSYSGSLTGDGDITVYATGPRISLNGNWSNFTGKLTINGLKTGHYDPEMTFNNSYGMRNASLHVATRMSNSGKDFAIGQLTGGGTLAGSGRYTIGYLNSDITFTGAFEGCTITKVGSGSWTLMKESPNLGSGQVEVRGGMLNISSSQTTNLFFGSHQVVAQDSGTLAGRGYLQGITLQKGGRLKPGNVTSSYPVGLMKVKESIFAFEGSHLEFFIFNNKNTNSSRSFLEVGSTLSINGDITVTMKGYTPALGDEIILWTAKSVTGTPTAVYLPDISEYGLGWDYTQLMSAEGKLRVVSAEDGIASISAGTPVRVKVYSLNGILLGSFECTRSEVKARMQQEHLGRGTFVVRMQSTDRSETVKIIL